MGNELVHCICCPESKEDVILQGKEHIEEDNVVHGKVSLMIM